jgi:predicted short-subunit dehydrogenase-like oxidoreductase (DUF2520 family)
MRNKEPLTIFKDKIVIIGAGKVATNLSLALLKKGFTVSQVYNRSLMRAKSLAKKLHCQYTSKIEELAPASLYIIAIKDDAIQELISKIKIKEESTVVHTSGSIPSEIFETSFKNFGVFYPLQTFSTIQVSNFRTVPICLEASNLQTFQYLKAIAEILSGQVFELTSEQRKVLHLGAVFACNFSNYMYTIASDIMESAHLDFKMLLPLIEETAKKLKKQHPKLSQTGPALRGDDVVLRKHLQLLDSKKNYQDIYKLLSKGIKDINQQK